MLLRFFSLRLGPSGLVARYAIVILFTFLVVTHWFYVWPATFMLPGANFQFHNGDPAKDSFTYGGVQSPIRELMVNASAQFNYLLSRRTGDMWTAGSRYRIRRGRHPPPGFDKWVEAATNSNAVIVEEFFDRIYKDITPFWGLDPKVLREQAKRSPWVVSIRNGDTITHKAAGHHPRSLDDWADLIREFSEHMPDLDMPINLANEARLLVPFGEIDRLVQKESEKRKLTALTDVTHEFMNLSALDGQNIAKFEPNWISSGRSHWDVALRTCNPGSPASKVDPATDLASHGTVPLVWQPGYAFGGFVQNWTAAMDLCEQPHVGHMHRAFTQPRTTSTTEELVPLFSGSKMPRNNDILIPGAMYLSEEETDSNTLRGPWTDKQRKVFWRGDADRLVKMLDGRLVSKLETTNKQEDGFNLPSNDLYISERRKKRSLGLWLSSIVNASTDNTETSLSSQVDNRFLPDVDGPALSPRFRSLLRSSSLPLKSTLFTEWHDDRLIPWMHFVPLDSTLQDLHAILEFFADGSGVGDAAARFIAERGAEWADKVLRREDMKLYLWRLLLEWARVVDKNRDTLCFTGDVMEHPD